jgi:hypothetical protein
LNSLSERLSPPKDPDPSMWIDEAIWGHRLHDEQSLWLIYMEFLNVFMFEYSKNRAFSEAKGYNTLCYKPCKRLHLRNILFNNPKLENIRLIHANDSERWKAWFREMETAPGINNPDFRYLKKHFGSFEDFYQIVSIIRSTSLEMNSNKRWTSKFVFPYGEDCLFEDLHQSTNTNDRRFFGRTGEILYLMLCRSRHTDKLLSALGDIMMQAGKWNKIVRRLQPDSAGAMRSERANAFLPYMHHDTFDTLAKDWLSIFRLNIPSHDMIPHLVNLAGFHMVKYQLDVSRQLLESATPATLVCEIVAPKKTIVRELSCEHYQENNSLPEQAVEYYLADIKKTSEWIAAVSGHDAFMKCRRVLEEKVLWPRNESDYDGPNDPDRLIEDLRDAALKRHRRHIANVHRNYGRAIGLVSKRGTNKLRYAPTDNLLKSLLLSNVPDRIELNHFLARLAERYGLIFGDREAERILPREDFDKKAFQANSRRLEQRLASLGLLRRLSDGCAYIINPHRTGK